MSRHPDSNNYWRRRDSPRGSYYTDSSNWEQQRHSWTDDNYQNYNNNYRNDTHYNTHWYPMQQWDPSQQPWHSSDQVGTSSDPNHMKAAHRSAKSSTGSSGSTQPSETTQPSTMLGAGLEYHTSSSYKPDESCKKLPDKPKTNLYSSSKEVVSQKSFHHKSKDVVAKGSCLSSKPNIDKPLTSNEKKQKVSDERTKPGSKSKPNVGQHLKTPKAHNSGNSERRNISGTSTLSNKPSSQNVIPTKDKDKQNSETTRPLKGILKNPSQISRSSQDGKVSSVQKNNPISNNLKSADKTDDIQHETELLGMELNDLKSLINNPKFSKPKYAFAMEKLAKNYQMQCSREQRESAQSKIRNSSQSESVSTSLETDVAVNLSNLPPQLVEGFRGLLPEDFFNDYQEASQPVSQILNSEDAANENCGELPFQLDVASNKDSETPIQANIFVKEEIFVSNLIKPEPAGNQFGDFTMPEENLDVDMSNQISTLQDSHAPMLSTLETEQEDVTPTLMPLESLLAPLEVIPNLAIPTLPLEVEPVTSILPDEASPENPPLFAPLQDAQESVESAPVLESLASVDVPISTTAASVDEPVLASTEVVDEPDFVPTAMEEPVLPLVPAVEEPLLEPLEAVQEPISSAMVPSEAPTTQEPTFSENVNSSETSREEQQTQLLEGEIGTETQTVSGENIAANEEMLNESESNLEGAQTSNSPSIEQKSCPDVLQETNMQVSEEHHTESITSQDSCSSHDKLEKPLNSVGEDVQDGQILEQNTDQTKSLSEQHINKDCPVSEHTDENLQNTNQDQPLWEQNSTNENSVQAVNADDVSDVHMSPTPENDTGGVVDKEQDSVNKPSDELTVECKASLLSSFSSNSAFGSLFCGLPEDQPEQPAPAPNIPSEQHPAASAEQDRPKYSEALAKAVKIEVDSSDECTKLMSDNRKIDASYTVPMETSNHSLSVKNNKNVGKSLKMVEMSTQTQMPHEMLPRDILEILEKCGHLPARLTKLLRDHLLSKDKVSTSASIPVQSMLARGCIASTVTPRQSRGRHQASQKSLAQPEIGATHKSCTPIALERENLPSGSGSIRKHLDCSSSRQETTSEDDTSGVLSKIAELDTSGVLSKMAELDTSGVLSKMAELDTEMHRLITRKFELYSKLHVPCVPPIAIPPLSLGAAPMVVLPSNYEDKNLSMSESNMFPGTPLLHTVSDGLASPSTRTKSSHTKSKPKPTQAQTNKDTNKTKSTRTTPPRTNSNKSSRASSNRDVLKNIEVPVNSKSRRSTSRPSYRGSTNTSKSESVNQLASPRRQRHESSSKSSYTKRTGADKKLVASHFDTERQSTQRSCRSNASPSKEQVSSEMPGRGDKRQRTLRSTSVSDKDQDTNTSHDSPTSTASSRKQSSPKVPRTPARDGRLTQDVSDKDKFSTVEAKVATIKTEPSISNTASKRRSRLSRPRSTAPQVVSDHEECAAPPTPAPTQNNLEESKPDENGPKLGKSIRKRKLTISTSEESLSPPESLGNSPPGIAKRRNCIPKSKLTNYPTKRATRHSSVKSEINEDMKDSPVIPEAQHQDDDEVASRIARRKKRLLSDTDEEVAPDSKGTLCHGDSPVSVPEPRLTRYNLRKCVILVEQLDTSRIALPLIQSTVDEERVDIPSGDKADSSSSDDEDIPITQIINKSKEKRAKLEEDVLDVESKPEYQRSPLASDENSLSTLVSDCPSLTSDGETRRPRDDYDRDSEESSGHTSKNKSKKHKQDTRLEFQSHQGPILDIKTVGRHVLAASEDGNVYCYSLKSGRFKRRYEGHTAAVTCLYVVEDPGIKSEEDKEHHTSVYSASLDTHLLVHSFKSGLRLHEPVHVESPVLCMDYNWGYIYMGTKLGEVARFSIKKHVIVGEHLKFSDEAILALKATKEGPRKVLIVGTRNQAVAVRDATNGLFLRVMTNWTHTVYSLLLESNLVYCGTKTGAIPVFEFTTGLEVCRFVAKQGVVCMRTYANLLFAGCYDGNIYVYNIQDKSLIACIAGPGHMLLCMDIVKNRVIAGSKEGNKLEAWSFPPEVKSIIKEAKHK